MPHTLHVVSDATGGLARHLITAVLSQFPSDGFKVVYHPFLNTAARIRGLKDKLRGRRQLVLHALIDPEAKNQVGRLCDASRTPYFDLTGSLVQFIANHTGVAPANDLARLHAVDAGYFQRIAAMEFTAQHDDARQLETLREADLVLLGLSRVSKSPTATFLGAQGLKVANVSIAPQTGLPRELKRVKKGRVVALTLQPKALQTIRKDRLAEFDEGDHPYHDLRSVIREVMWAESLYREHHYHLLDVTGRTIESSAARILELTGVTPPAGAYA